jgi:hypothetical protein
MKSKNDQFDLLVSILTRPGRNLEVYLEVALNAFANITACCWQVLGRDLSLFSADGWNTTLNQQ